MSDDPEYSHLDPASMRRAADPQLLDRLAAAEAALAEAQALLAAARRLHQPRSAHGEDVCAECSRLASSGEGSWPCRTALALGQCGPGRQ